MREDKEEDKKAHIKTYLNNTIKIVNISFEGINSDKKLINISDILRRHSIKDGLPQIEEYKFFSIEEIESNAERYSEEYKNKEEYAERLNLIKTSLKEFEELLIFIREKKEEISSKYVRGTFHGYKVVYKKDLIYICKIQSEIESKKKEINKSNLIEALNECKTNFIRNLRGALERHDLRAADVEKDVEKKFSFIDDIDKYLEKISLKCDIILDLSDEVLNDISLKNELKNLNIKPKVRQKIEEYYELIKDN